MAACLCRRRRPGVGGNRRSRQRDQDPRLPRLDAQVPAEGGLRSRPDDCRPLRRQDRPSDPRPAHHRLVDPCPRLRHRQPSTGTRGGCHPHRSYEPVSPDVVVHVQAYAHSPSLRPGSNRGWLNTRRRRTELAQIQLDNRGLLPPEPMVRILEMLKDLPDGDELVALMDREPLLLYTELERRGFVWEFSEDDASGTLIVRRPAP
ncbi:MAG: DUF2249 domain-containing protein [Dehalococcoidia bacterium]|nr:DUF2249 domain-containing protein [Dehalococcoidia bacterium]MCA9846165.1 DUF2249 domain-containing protein [Dehalococcoidia bacterium]MCA9852634.1 DUF2249 domain-containing protein [Dehalococcoidia bacterium]